MTMKCPKCGAEFVDGITTCTDCQTPLVRAEDKTEWVGEAAEVKMLGSFGDHLEVELLQEILEQRGIPSYVLERESGGYMKVFMGYSVFGEDLYVKKSDYEAAKECMEEYESLKSDGGLEGSYESQNEENTWDGSLESERMSEEYGEEESFMAGEESFRDEQDPFPDGEDQSEDDEESGMGFKNPLIMENRHLAAIILLIAAFILGVLAVSPPGF